MCLRKGICVCVDVCKKIWKVCEKTYTYVCEKHYMPVKKRVRTWGRLSICKKMCTPFYMCEKLCSCVRMIVHVYEKAYTCVQERVKKLVWGLFLKLPSRLCVKRHNLQSKRWFKFSFLLLVWFPSKTLRPSLSCYFTHIWWRCVEGWIHTIPKFT